MTIEILALLGYGRKGGSNIAGRLDGGRLSVLAGGARVRRKRSRDDFEQTQSSMTSSDCGMVRTIRRRFT
jgi:hypothetical protein